MTPSPAAPAAPSPTTSDRLRHVRWIVGGTGSGKTTLAEVLARRFELDLYAGDRAEHDWADRSSTTRHPRLAALRNQRPGDLWRNRSPEQVFESMASRAGEPVEFLIEDLLARSARPIVLVDYFGVLPRHLAPLLSWVGQAVFLVPTAQFRRAALIRRYTDKQRARANWGELDPAEVIEARLARDALWDAEVIEQARELQLPLLTVDGTRSVADVATELAGRFQLDTR